MAAEATVTPYSTITPYAGALPAWAGPDAGERLAAYTAYQNMYFSEEEAFQLIRRNEDGAPLYIPKPKVIADTTSHYLLKGMHVGVADPEKSAELQLFIDSFCKRERFYSRFEVAKLAGVVRGDWVFHITADPMKPEGSRISINSMDPAVYFPEFDSDDLERRTGVKLVSQELHPDDPSKTVVRVLRYWYELDTKTGNRINDLVWREENIWEMEGWNNPKKAKKIKAVIAAGVLPTGISQIPVYHFKNAEFDGFDFGNSELKGYERVFQGINQAMSDVEISLALVGLGVYATDAGRPKNSRGEEEDWVVSPGTVWEMPGATMVKRLEGITSVTPVLDHVRYLEEALFQGSATSDVALGRIDSQTAESGIALALKFLPTLAKIEYRDTAGVEILTQLWYDWKFWVQAYESKTFIDTDIVITLGEKLPLNRAKTIEELNNLLDRKVISRKFYRAQLTKLLGYVFPASIENDIIQEQIEMERARLELAAEFAPEEDENDAEQIGPGGRKVGAGDTKEAKDKNRSNNKAAPNESKGTEVKK